MSSGSTEEIPRKSKSVCPFDNESLDAFETELLKQRRLLLD